MKKFFSISITFLLLGAMLHLSVATHYCAGIAAASKISLSGKTASCGMESEGNAVSASEVQFSRHCCDNVVHTYGITSIFNPTFTSLQKPYQQHLLTFIIPGNIALSFSASVENYKNESPPGISVSNMVDLAKICIFRI